MSFEAAPQPIRAMVVDDSAIVRGLIVGMLKADSRIAVTASCSNGEMAVAQAARKPVDVIILDIEMPVMDGLSALPKLLQASPGVSIIMASTLTQRNAAISLRALSLGAADYIAKPTSDRLGASENFQRELIEKVLVLGQAGKSRASPDRQGERFARLSPQPKLQMARPPRMIAIGSSTGGPQALLSILGGLPASVKSPIVIAQHMPPTFTTVLAQHIAKASGRSCREAHDGMEIKPGEICLAPGDYHLEVTGTMDHSVARLSQTAPENFCRPSVDPLFRSVARVFGPNGCALVLTGMGNDGLAGARVMAAAGAPILAQDEATSVVWGMPGAVANAGLCSAVLPLNRIAHHLAGLFAREAA